jgi:uncharacterized protein (DUF1015 family)
MSSILPFRAHFPPSEHAAAIASVPYDVISSSEAAVLAEGNPLSFLHVIRPEIDLPAGTDLYADVVYDQARAALEQFVAEVPYTQPETPVLLVYRLATAERAQVGVVGGCSIDEYDSGLIAIHERTRQAKEDDRSRHVVTMRCQAEPIFLAYRGQANIDNLVAEAMTAPPLYDFEAVDGVRHTVWSVERSVELSAAFEAVPRLYVADGHHRAKSASRARQTLRAVNPKHTGSESYNQVMAVVFPDSELAILPYNRVVTDLGGRSADGVVAAISQRFPLEPWSAEPGERGHFCMFANGSWHRFHIPAPGTSVISDLDVSLLQEEVFAPSLGITDPRTDSRIDFVGGARGTGELEARAVASGGIAFSMFATSLDELFAVADAGEIMPPKSTWFEPKLRSGLFLHRL